MEFMAGVLILWFLSMFVNEKIMKLTGFDRGSVMFMCIGGVFVMSAFFPLIGIPLRDLKSADIAFDDGIMYMAIFLGVGAIFFGVIQGTYKKNRH